MRAPVHRHAPEPTGFTPCESDVVAKLADGMTRKEIASHSGRALATVEHHIFKAKQKSGARTIYHLTAMFARGELV